MEGGDGMVAVVRGLRDAGLAVTLLDGCRRYTLVPNAGVFSPVPRSTMPTQVHTREIPECMPVTSDVCTEPILRCESSAQATDGRYASVYKTAHCNLTPTSPPVQLTEFPPQRAELCPGHGNFEVGGTGSGEKYSPVKPTTQFRGGMSWPDRGSVCAPRPSYEPDSFANSLRKYPNMTPRSSEMVERLVNYTQARHSNKSPPRSRASPTRLCECNSNHKADVDSRVLPTRHRSYEPEVTIRSRPKTDESPTREGRPRRPDNCPDLSGTAFCKSFEARCLRDLSRRTKDIVRNSLAQLSHQPCYMNNMESCDHHAEEPQNLPRRNLIRPNRNSISTEIQAVAHTVSREVATLPRIEPAKRNVAVPLSPISSITQHCQGSQLMVVPTLALYKSVQTIPISIASKTRKSVQATSSSIELLTVNKWHNDRSERKTKSQEELRSRRDDFKREILQLLENIDCHNDEMYRALRDELIRKIKRNKRRITFGMDGHAKSSPYWFKTTCKHCLDNCKRIKKLDVLRADTKNVGVPSDDSLHNVIKDWLHEIHMKNSEFLKSHSMDEIINSLTTKLRHLCISSEEITKLQIMEMIEEVTFDASDSDRNVQMNNLADALANKIKEVLHSRTRKSNRCIKRKKNVKNKNYDYFPFKKIIQPTEEEVRGFVREELLLFMDKINLQLKSTSITEVEMEVIDVLIDSINELQWGDNEKVKEELAIALGESSKLPVYYLKCLADALVNRFKEFMHTFNAINMEKVERQTYVVLQNTVQNSSRQQNETISDVDVEARIEEYTSQLTQVIEAWWTSILGADENEKGFREVAINDLAGDIVDRHRFLEMDTSKRWSNEEEVEYLKYQIFRWINKLVGEEAMQQAQDRAAQLMEQIQRIPVPVMKLTDDAKSKNMPPLRPQSPLVMQSPGKAKPNININQGPIFGQPGRGGSLSEGSRRQGTPARRMSGPATYSMGPATNAVCIKERQVGNLSQSLNRTSPSRRFSVPAENVTPMDNLHTAMPTIRELNQDIDSYIRDWVNQIPIAVNNPQEQEQAEKLKINIHSGIWKALAKMEMDSATIRNEFYFQDRFDDELEEILSSLPSSPELTSQKPSLKAKLIERTKHMVNMVRKVDQSGSFKHQALNAITHSLPPRPKIDDQEKSPAHLFEELLKRNITEDYVLFRLYQDTHKVKAEPYRQKMIMSLQKLHENAKLLPGNQLINPDVEAFTFKILNSMVGVAKPDIHIHQDEVDQIILGHEIAQWLQDLPVPQNESHLGHLQTRKLREILAKKINDIEKQTNLCDNSAIRQLKNELSKFIEKFSPPPEEAGHLSFLIDEFINRLKNRREEVQEPIEFGWFKHNIAISSSVAEDIGQIGASRAAQSEIASQSHIAGHSPIAAPSPIAAHSPIAAYSPIAAQSQMTHQDLSRADSSHIPYQEPSNVEWLSLITTQERILREREAEAQREKLPQIPPCCQPLAASPPQETSSMKWFTLVNSPEAIQLEMEHREGPSPHIPPCCQSVVPTSQREYNVVRPVGFFEQDMNGEEIGLHTSQIAGPSYAPIARVPQQIVSSPAAASMHSQMRHLVELQDQRQNIMPNVVPTTHPSTSGVASFIQRSGHPSMQVPVTGNGVLGSSQLSRPIHAGPGDPSARGTPLVQRSVRPRQIGSPQQFLSSRSPLNQSQYELAAPLARQEPAYSPRHGLQEIAEQNLSRPALSPMDLSIRGPVGFSTPRQAPASPGRGAPEIPGAPRARRKRRREEQGGRTQPPRRRLDVEELEEEEEERERDEVQCRCTERVYRCRRRRPMCCDCDDMDYPRYYPMPYPYCFY